MASKKRLGILLYASMDFLMAMLAWAIFFIYRQSIEGNAFSWEFLNDDNFLYGVLIIPLVWIAFYSIFDKYQDIYRFSRFATLTRTFFLSLVGVTLLFFTLILDDFVSDYRTYYSSFLTLFLTHFGLTALARMALLTWASNQLKSGKVGYSTIIIGGDRKAVELYQDIMGRRKRLGHHFIGYIDSNGNSTNELGQFLPVLGKIEDIRKIVVDKGVEEVIIAIETSEHNRLREILNTLFDFGRQLLVKIIPDMYDIMLGTVKMNHVYGAVLIEIQQELMPKWQRLVKRMMDIVVSCIGLIILSPLYLYTMLRVRMSSPGAIFFSQDRIGINGVPFKIYKFRSMFVDSEPTGPQLSHENDERCTKWGAIMRKWRIDELPQFWNVLKGDMSLVGPRPERQFFIDQIMAHAPHYKHLLKVRPGITSWGQVKYGYASDLDQMLQRLKFDILYIENMSLGLDFKILFYTLLVLIKGEGK